MRYAICYRGISYFENYTHDNRSGMTPYNIDFSYTIQSNLDKIINPIIGHDNSVDIFFNTYDSVKLHEYIEKLNPVAVNLREFDSNITYCNWSHIWQLNIDSLNMIRTYQNEVGINYDYIILSRFDLYMIENFYNVYIQKGGVSAPTKEDDMFIVIDGCLLDRIIELFDLNKNAGMIHLYTKILSESGILCHSMYDRNFNPYNYPFFRNSRDLFSHKGHIYNNYTLDDVYDENSKHYAFFHKPHTNFVSCYE